MPTLFSVGKALQTFHNLESTHEIKPINFNEMENYFHVRIEKILKNNNLFAKGLGERIIHYLRNNQSELDARDLKQTISHCDFSPGNILVSQSGIAILDFARVNQWSPFLDLTHLYHHIYNFSYKPIFDKKTVQNITDSFLAGYGDINLKNHVLFKLFLIQNKLCQLVYLSRKSEHSLKSRLYNHYVMTKSVEMLEKMVPG
ncbi:MAG: phosphotransferase [Nitrospinota bacterium]